MMDWKDIKLDLKKIFNFQEDKPYLSELITNLEALIASGKNIPFKITDIRSKGFIVKAEGLFGYISFNYMPWKYSNIKAWEIIYPYIKGRVFFGRSHHFSKDPLSVILNGEVPQFKKPELVVEEKYIGIVLYRTSYGIFIDIGYHFDWDYGSIVGMIHRSNFVPPELFDTIELGERFETYYLGETEQGKYNFGNIKLLEDWSNGEADKLQGKIVTAHVVQKQDHKRYFLVNDKYMAILPLSTTIYKKSYKAIRGAMANLKDGDQIHCEVLEVNQLTKRLLLKWDFSHEIAEIALRDITEENPIENPIDELTRRNYCLENLVDKDIIEKLVLVGKNIDVEVVKKTDNLGKTSNKYLIDNKHNGKLSISNDNYKISVKEKELIENNLQDGEILNCEVLSVDKNQLKINWKIKDDELIRFIRE